MTSGRRKWSRPEKPDQIVSNTSPIIALSYVGDLPILHRLFKSDIIIPPAVGHELRGQVLAPWITIHKPGQPPDAQITRSALGAGESEAIALALEIQADLVLLDDQAARRLAAALHLPLMGTLGLLLKAKDAGLISAVRPKLEALQALPFHIAPRLLEAVLREAHE